MAPSMTDWPFRLVYATIHDNCCKKHLAASKVDAWITAPSSGEICLEVKAGRQYIVDML